MQSQSAHKKWARIFFDTMIKNYSVAVNQIELMANECQTIKWGFKSKQVEVLCVLRLNSEITSNNEKQEFFAKNHREWEKRVGFQCNQLLEPNTKVNWQSSKQLSRRNMFNLRTFRCCQFNLFSL